MSDALAAKVANHWGQAEPQLGGDFYTFPPLVRHHIEAVTQLEDGRWKD